MTALPLRDRLIRPVARVPDRAFAILAGAGALLIGFLLVAIALRLLVSSIDTWRTFGLIGFVVGQVWDVGAVVYGALPFIAGTLVTAGLAMLIAVPLGVLAAIYLAEFAPRRLAMPLVTLIELIAAIPSVVIGLWGLVVLTPILRDTVESWVTSLFPDVPFLAGPPLGSDIFTASLILAVMVTPTIVALGREVILALPANYREAYVGLGATRWETVATVVLPSVRAGLLGACILALGRAMGETMAVTMTIGNADRIPTGLFDQGQTIASKIATSFVEASSAEETSALLALGLVLMVLTLIVGIIARMLVGRSRTAVG
ncbi:MAG: phosphate ABC transporter permease subunit PstC [Chloroflexota bacterium]